MSRSAQPFSAPSARVGERCRATLPWLGSIAAHVIVLLGAGLSLHGASQVPVPAPLIDIVLHAAPAKPTAPAVQPSLQAISPPKPPTASPVFAQKTPVPPLVPTPPIIDSAAAPSSLAVNAAPSAPQVVPPTVALANPAPAPKSTASPTSSTATAAPAPPAPAPLTHADVKTAYLQNPKPFYPSLSARLGEAGTVMLWVAINAGGSVDDIGVLRSSGFARLDTEALRAVRQWRFTPAMRGGQAVPDKVSVPIEFGL